MMCIYGGMYVYISICTYIYTHTNTLYAFVYVYVHIPVYRHEWIFTQCPRDTYGFCLSSSDMLKPFCLHMQFDV